eukprot:SAG31_NODE_2642_length_5323_cov_3.407351_2_plen_39_part_00
MDVPVYENHIHDHLDTRILAYLYRRLMVYTFFFKKKTI